MGNEWQFISLGDVIELKRGYDLPKKLRNPGDVPLISSAGVSDSHSESKVKGPGVVTGRYGTIGKVFFSPNDFWPLNTTLYVRDFKGNDPKFIFYFLKTLNFEEFSDKAAVPGVNRNHLHMAKVHVPTSISEQKAIAHILGTLDDKIELNRRMNATLEGMAQALFKSWFVDFDPVIDNAIKAGNPIPDELADRAEVRRQALADGTANREAAKPFPDSFQETESMGWIPMGWDATAISKAIRVNPSTKLKKGSHAPFADMKALPTTGYAIDGVIEKAYSGGAKFQNNDVLLARITPCLQNGKTGIVDFLTDESPVGFGSTEFIVLRGEGDLSTAFIACLARDSNFRKHCEQSMIGSSGRQRVHNSCFESYFIALPKNRDLMSIFNTLSIPAFAKASKQSNENKILAKLRDTLLPKLISGEQSLPTRAYLES